MLFNSFALSLNSLQGMAGHAQATVYSVMLLELTMYLHQTERSQMKRN
jgi:hypothetical protein